ncbi:MAG TPA: DegV family protein [Jiangellaceae bacterium]|nr:DegV family protein [Jiangellaceae bacterium]
MTVTVITDTAASIGRQLADEWNVRLAPLTIAVTGRTYRDTEIDLSNLPTGRITTSGPSPGDFLAAFSDARDGAVIVTVATSLSSTNASARAAASASDLPVEIVDSGTAAGAQALVVLAAAERAAQGGNVGEVAEAARAAAREVQLVGCLASLDGLARSGRVPGLAALAARMTGALFMFRLQGGSIRPIKPATSRSAALDRMVDMCVSSGHAGLVADLVTLGDDAELRERLEQARDSGRLVIGRWYAGTFGTAITVYTGPHVTGLAWRWIDAGSERRP